MLNSGFAPTFLKSFPNNYFNLMLLSDFVTNPAREITCTLNFFLGLKKTKKQKQMGTDPTPVIFASSPISSPKSVISQWQCSLMSTMIARFHPKAKYPAPAPRIMATHIQML